MIYGGNSLLRDTGLFSKSHPLYSHHQLKDQGEKILMSHDDANIDWKVLKSIFDEQMRWASLSVTIQEIADDNKALIRDLSHYDPNITIPLLAGLLTLPEYQTACIRLETLVALAVIFCKGRKKPNIDNAVRWFFQIGKSRCVIGEDPAEDVFVSLVTDCNGNYRLVEGVWEAAGFYTQRILEVVSTMPDTGEFGRIKRSFHAILIISDIVCEQAGLRRYQLGSDERNTALSARKLPGRNALISRVTLSFEELREKGVTKSDIAPFLFDHQMRDSLVEQQIGCSDLDRCPLILQSSTHLSVALPSALSVAARDFVIAHMIEGGLTDAFNSSLAKNYTELFFNTPLLGGRRRAPVLWKKLGPNRLSTFAFEVDHGYFISYHLFLTSVATHDDGGFKSAYQDEGALTDALQESISSAIEQLSKRSDFKKGVIVLVGCGWGKGYLTQEIKVNHPKWRFESMSAADLVRLSWLSDMNPSYFWRIQDGLEAVTKNGVRIVNPNGILNLIGWVRSNDGHFVPHAQLLDEEVSPEQPLMLNLPVNLLRGVRAEADLGYDRHRAVDNTGVWHDVQHLGPNPFFTSESARRLYASVGHALDGMFTSVYEGKLLLWLSLTAPNIADRDIEFRLWEMANEWLHRIGSKLDRYAGHLTKTTNLKVYVEFQDIDPPKEPGQKAKADDLSEFCVIKEYEEPNAIKAVFKAGFLSGFGIAENVAERLFVLNISRAFLHLLNVTDSDREAEEITRNVVQNQEARSFHVIHAHHFIDYVHDTLSEKLVIIDEIDDATAKIGLGWRVYDRMLGNKIEGREACTNFLGNVVDVLLAEICEMLVCFERVSTLKRLVANNEKSSVELDWWKRTSAAIIGLHGSVDSTVQKYTEQTSKFAGAGIASRVLIEMAVCVCPLNDGAQLSDIELSKLIARASLLVRIGGLSDAIHYSALAPELTISSLGDVLLRDDFVDLVVQPMLSRVLGEKFIANAPLQKKNYDEPVFTSTSKGQIDEEFLRIWRVEMGFDLDEARNIIDSLEDKGITDHSAIYSISQSEYFPLVCSDQVSEDSALKFLEQFSLKTRHRWDKPSKGFAIKDIYPWRFGRRLSFVTRPILKVDESNDSQLLIAPAALRKGFAYVVAETYSGRFDQSFFRSDEMKNTWWGKASEGHSFNAEVAQRLLDAGWKIRENIEIPEILNQKTEQNFGDVDVLAWRPDRQDVLVIECKDLSLARNYSEIAALISSFQGANVDGKPDSLKKHLIRVSILERNLEHLQRFTGIQEPNIVSCLVCSGVVPMQYSKIEALSKTHVGSVDDLLALYSC
ncbi:anti-phage protein Upx [Methylomicrobium lacus]|uniref:anti-phage protein Upx n=1 Tax=Methylomicrobium lacus TaxID=136992 RepID=UPI001FDFDA69|nr:anti-phage protein Upx [Methylomicrobium lacus]